MTSVNRPVCTWCTNIIFEKMDDFCFKGKKGSNDTEKIMIRKYNHIVVYFVDNGSHISID